MCTIQDESRSKYIVGVCSPDQNCLDSLPGDNALVSFRGENACLDRAAKEAIGLSDLWRRF